VEVCHWTLNAINETDIDLLFPLILYSSWRRSQKSEAPGREPEREAYADQLQL
jgi:hypothetical protein